MSWQPCEPPQESAAPAQAAIATVIVPRPRDIGGFQVRRVLPSARRRMVGPFIFLDQMGPAVLAAGQGIDVRPHPHIGLATVTYLFAGSILHRDSLGSVQPIEAGDVNWMTAGRGIVHSERSDAEARKVPRHLFGLQFWVALPQRHEETAPAFAHHPRTSLPAIEGDGVQARLVAGTLFGETSPVATLSPLFLADVSLAAGACLALDAGLGERGAYVIEGNVEVDGETYDPGRMLVFAPGRAVALKAASPAKLVVLGGETLDGPRHIWWNFVSSSKARIEQAKADWQRDRFGVAVPGETEFIPLPEGS